MADQTKLQTRLPHDVHKWIKESAKAHNRSINGQIVEIFRQRMKEESSEGNTNEKAGT